MEKFKFGDRVIYRPILNTRKFEKDLSIGDKGIIYQLFEALENINYMVEFDNGLLKYIDQKDLRLLA